MGETLSLTVSDDNFFPIWRVMAQQLSSDRMNNKAQTSFPSSVRIDAPTVNLSGRIPHPFPYQGSKRKIASWIVDHIPADTKTLFEPFAGSAAISLAVAYLGKTGAFVINDVHEPLVSLWRSIINETQKLSDDYESLWIAQQGRDRVFYDEVRTAFNKDHAPHHFLYLLARCVKAAIRYNSSGEFNNSPDKRRQGMRPELMRSNLFAVARLLSGRTTVHCRDFADAIGDATPEDVVYMDPPYQGVSDTHNHRYMKGLVLDHFIDTLESLNKRKVSYIVSYDGRTGDKVHGIPLPKYLNLYHEEIAAGKSTQATLLGRSEETFESLYLSPALVARLGTPKRRTPKPEQFALFG